LTPLTSCWKTSLSSPLIRPILPVLLIRPAATPST
jgi:hypothetical protein